MTPLVAVSNVVLVAANTGEWKAIAVVARLSTYSLVAASAFCAGLARLLMYVLALNTTFPPTAFRFKLPVLESARAVPTTLLVLTLPAVALPVTDTMVPVRLATFTMVVNMPLLATALPAVEIFPPMILPVADIKPVTYSPVVANTATLPVPPTPTVMFPPELTTVTFDVPLLILATDVITPVRLAPLPRM